MSRTASQGVNAADWQRTVGMPSVKLEPLLSNPHQIRFRPADYSLLQRSRAAPGRRNSSNSSLGLGHGVRRAGSGGASPQGLVSVLLRVRSPESLCPPR